MASKIAFAAGSAAIAIIIALQRRTRNASNTLPSSWKELVSLMGLVPHPEGGYFFETHRSGSQPMVTRGQTALDVPPVALAACGAARAARRGDGDGRRNWLTSIFWLPTVASPTLFLAVNLSDHVHYYHGGCAFEYTLVDATTGALTVRVLGPDLRAGQVLQLAVAGGTWKAGRLLRGAGDAACDYCLIGEAVAPGFDFHDFSWVDSAQVRRERPSLWPQLRRFVKDAPEDLEGIDAYYGEK